MTRNTLLDSKVRYLQLALNYDVSLARQILPQIVFSERIFIEAGTPFIKLEGMDGVRAIRRMWQGRIVADMKVTDGAESEVHMAKQAGADAITVLGNSPTETLNYFIGTCRSLNMVSMIDMLGVDDPLSVIRPLLTPPDVIVLHRGRDEEGTRGKVIEYRHVNRVRSKFDVSISAAGGVDLKEARSAIFNGANVVVVNLVRPGDDWQGISTEDNIRGITQEFLTTIE
jgi:3-keto-L-gulonate-6-phosphate decarboxylase